MVTTGCGERALKRVLLSGLKQTVFSSLLLWRLAGCSQVLRTLSWSFCHLSPEITISWASCSCRGMWTAHSGSSCSAIVVEKVSFRKFDTYTDSCQGWTWVVWLRNLIPWIGCLIQDNKYETVLEMWGRWQRAEVPAPEALLCGRCCDSVQVYECGGGGVTVLSEDCRLLSKFHVECTMCSSSL